LIKTEIPFLILQKLKINMCKTNKHNKTILFYIKNTQYLLEFLESNCVDSIINHKSNNGDTFFDIFQEEKYSVRSVEQIYNVILLLEKKKFNGFCTNTRLLSSSLMDKIFMSGAHKYTSSNSCIEKIMRNCQIMSGKLLWVNMLTDGYTFTDRIIELILERHDFSTFIINLVTYGTNEDNILCIFKYLWSSNKFEEMLKTKNELGSNVLHLLSLYHYKKIIRFLSIRISTDSMKNLNIKNNNGDYPLDLYNKYDIKNILEYKCQENEITKDIL
jgi:hypothetical protein